MNSCWQKRKPQSVHADDWLMTYADLITLLLCFFAIIMVTTVTKKHAQQTAAQSVIAQPMETPAPQPTPQPQPQPLAMFPGNLPFRDYTLEEAAAAETVVVHVKQEPTPEPTMPPTEAIAPEPLAPVEAAPAQGPAPFEQKGDRIVSLELSSAAFFDSGSALLKQAGMTILQDVEAKLLSDQYMGYLITVEGHTDDTPIHTAQFPSNWELSTARASAVVHFFLEHGIPAQRLRAAGYADTFPKAPNRDDQGTPIAANRAENRRVVIKLEKIEKN